jgi:D-alanyl-lipoteichoic acid acyltransferase DltB (MBOAT superfamily)
MLFPTVTFASFFVVVLLVHAAASDRPRLRKLVLLVAAAVFYGYWDKRFVLLLAGVIVATWAFAVAIGRTAEIRVRRALVALALTLDVATLALFKYFDFFTGSFADAVARVGVHVQPPVLTLLLPVGLSFFLFEAMSYVVDVHRGRLQPARLIDVAVWLSFFPKLASGPITRAVEFVPQLHASAPVEVQLGRAYSLVARGLLKKLVIASFLTTAITADVFADPDAFNAAVVLLAVYAYAALIYTDFSGYTDMAIGLALLLGFTLPENFNRPYTATSVQDFWSRWHMTLSRWLRDYLFPPLVGGARSSRLRVYAGILAVMLIAGLWHGAAWGFVVFGGIHGLAMARERWSRDRRRARRRPRPADTAWRLAMRRFVTFHIVCLAWVFFAAGSVGGAGDVLAALATNWTLPVTTVTPLLVLVVAAVLAAQYLPTDVGARLAAVAVRAQPAAQAAALAVALVVILSLAPDTVPAFIYFRF